MSQPSVKFTYLPRQPFFCANGNRVVFEFGFQLRLRPAMTTRHDACLIVRGAGCHILVFAFSFHYYQILHQASAPCSKRLAVCDLYTLFAGLGRGSWAAAEQSSSFASVPLPNKEVAKMQKRPVKS